MEWVPDAEQVVVPEPIRRVCAGCPSRLACLQWAVGTGSEGYWAATTTIDRQTLTHAAGVDLQRAEELQAAVRQRAALAEAHDQAGALHPAGQDSLWWYRRGGCRCRRCRGHNAARRSEERARARQQTRTAAAQPVAA